MLKGKPRNANNLASPLALLIGRMCARPPPQHGIGDAFQGVGAGPVFGKELRVNTTLKLIACAIMILTVGFLKVNMPLCVCCREMRLCISAVQFAAHSPLLVLPMK